MKLFAKCVLLTIIIPGTVPAQNASKRSLVANLKNSAVADGCGCYFKFRGTPPKVERYIFALSIEGNEETAWMNIDGSDVKLLLVKGSGSKGKEGERVGSRSRETYASGDISVTGTYVVTRVCARNDENCESTDYNVTFAVKKGLKSQVVKAVGYCGC
jgi:hypothetical protein